MAHTFKYTRYYFTLMEWKKKVFFEVYFVLQCKNSMSISIGRHRETSIIRKKREKFPGLSRVSCAAKGNWCKDLDFEGQKNLKYRLVNPENSRYPEN